MSYSDFKFKGTVLNSNKSFFINMYGHDYFNRNWKKYYPDESHNIVISKWYPAEPLVKWMYDLSVEKNLGFRELMIMNSKYVMEYNLNGVYKFFMKLGGIKRILISSSQLTKAYNNFSDLFNIESKDGFFRSEMTIPEMFSEFAVFGYEGGLGGLLNVCGKTMTEFRIIKSDSFMKQDIKYSKVTFELKYK